MHSPTQPLITSAPPQILLIDNHDSFTHLLGDLIWRSVGISPTILPNNSPDLTASTLDNADLIVISPGPGHPGVAEDIGASTLAVQQETTPVIGVCLGHQAIALEAGARVERATAPMHGAPRALRVWRRSRRRCAASSSSSAALRRRACMRA